MSTEYIAKLVTINEPYCDSDGNIGFRNAISISKNGVVVDYITVRSSEDPANYDAAVAWVIGSRNFEWLD